MENVLPEIIDSLATYPASDGVNIPGFTSAKVKALLHRLISKLPPDECYLEIGCLCGSTLVSGLLDHKDVSAYACDNFSEFEARFDARKNLPANLAAYANRLPKIDFRNMDCFALAKEPAPFAKPIGIYFYDGAHDAQSQAKAIIEFERHLSRNAIVLVDDWNREHVRQGTWYGIDCIRPFRATFYELPSKGESDSSEFWNGVGAFFLELRRPYPAAVGG